MEQVFMEKLLEKKEESLPDYMSYEIYDDDGSRIRNPETLKAIAEGQEYLKWWRKFWGERTDDE